VLERQVRRCAEPLPHRAREAGVVHDAVPAVSGQVARGVEAVLRHQQGVRPGGGHRGADRPRDVVVEVERAEPAGHVADVDPPAVQPRVPEPAGHHRVRPAVQAAPKLRAAVVELRHGAEAEPPDVVVRVVVEEEEPGLGSGAVGQRRAEPVVPAPAVVRGEVADEAHPAGVQVVREAGERLVTAEEGIDALETRRVVAVAGPCREERRQVQRVRAQGGDVVQVGPDAVEVAAVDLAGALRSRPEHGVLPLRRDGPVGEGTLGRSREPVREHLVDHGVPGPLRGWRMGGEAEVGGVGHVAGVEPCAGEPLVPVPTAVEEPPVGLDHVLHAQIGAVPGVAVVPSVNGGGHQHLFAVHHGADHGAGDVALGRHAQEQRDHLAEAGRGGGDVAGRAVVMRLGPQVLPHVTPFGRTRPRPAQRARSRPRWGQVRVPRRT